MTKRFYPTDRLLNPAAKVVFYVVPILSRFDSRSKLVYVKSQYFQINSNPILQINAMFMNWLYYVKQKRDIFIVPIFVEA